MTTAKDAEKQLESFMSKYTPQVAALAREIRARMLAKYPTALELVYDNYNALAIGYAPSEKTSEAIFSIALFPRWVSLFFLQAKGLPDPEGILKGSGSVAKHVVLPAAEALDHPAVRDLMDEAVARAKASFPRTGKSQLIIKSVSAKQRARRPASGSARVAGSSGRKARSIQA